MQDSGMAQPMHSDPNADLGGSPDNALAEGLRRMARELRAAASAIESEACDLVTYDRPDVWQGGRATEFRRSLDDHVRMLTGSDIGTAARLRQAAHRIEARVDAIMTCSASQRPVPPD
jgi:hypothetical protein